DKGKFNISGIAEGKYYLLVSYLGYKPIFRPVNFTKEDHKLDIDNIIMKNTAIALNEVNIEQFAPPLRISGDTLDFNAGSFKTKPNAVVEDLLKKIPGIEVTPDGTIKSEGEEISQILVDGKRFVSNDPKIATKNLPSEMIERAQSLDKNSSQT